MLAIVKRVLFLGLYSMFKDFFTLSYHHKLVENFAVSSLSGALASNLLGPIFTLIVVYDVISPLVLLIWILISIVIFTIRVVLSKQLLKEKKREKYKRFLEINLFLVLVTAILYIAIIWISVISQASDLQIFVLLFTLIVISAGSIGTLGNIYIIFLSYLLTSLIPSAAILLYQGEELFE